jgi:phosphoglycolate phosphatase-like HAD superfamily hydrolase
MARRSRPAKRAKPPRGIVFDFDGVLLESAEVKTWAFGELFKAFPRWRKKIVDFHRRHQGVSRYEKFRRIYRDFLRRPLPAGEMRRLDRRFSRLVFNRVLRSPEVPGAGALLRRFRGKFRFYVASGTPEGELRRIVRRKGWSRRFAGILGSPRSKTAILKSLPGPKRRYLYIGDAAGDRLAARAAGVPFVGRARGRSPFPKKVPVVRDMREFARWLVRNADGQTSMRVRRSL